MTYATAMVVVEPGRSNANLLAFAANLATRMEIGLTGVAACQPMGGIYDQTMILGDYVQEDRDELDVEIAAAKTEFETALKGRGIDFGWHAVVTIGSLCEYTVARARAADIILCATGGDQMTIASRRAGISDMVMHAGRPVLLVPATVDKLVLDHAVVAWKDTREARRAIADSLPLLKLARKVTLVEIAIEAEVSDATLRLADLVEWLGRHRRRARTGGLTARIGEIAMPDIMHLVTIDTTPDRVFAALATADGVRSWWTRDADLDTCLGGKGEFRFYDGSKVTAVAIDELDPPNRVGWTVLNSFRSEWEGTAIVFNLRVVEGGTALRFAHCGFPRPDDDYAVCTTGWGIYLAGLKSVLEGGIANPR